MGTEYYLVNHKNKTVFELGKGPWFSIMDPELNEAFLYKDTFVKYFVEAADEYFSGILFGGNQEKSLKYYNQIAHMLYDFIEGADPEDDLFIANDCDDSSSELRDKGYLFIGSRYFEMEDYNTYMVDQNKHIGSVDLSNIDFTWPISRIRKLIPFM